MVTIAHPSRTRPISLHGYPPCASRMVVEYRRIRCRDFGRFHPRMRNRHQPATSVISLSACSIRRLHAIDELNAGCAIPTDPSPPAAENSGLRQTACLFLLVAILSPEACSPVHRQPSPQPLVGPQEPHRRPNRPEGQRDPLNAAARQPGPFAGATHLHPIFASAGCGNRPSVLEGRGCMAPPYSRADSIVVDGGHEAVGEPGRLYDCDRDLCAGVLPRQARARRC